MKVDLNSFSTNMLNLSSAEFISSDSNIVVQVEFSEGKIFAKNQDVKLEKQSTLGLWVTSPISKMILK